MFKRIDTTEFQASGKLQRDSLEYLCMTEEAQHATLQQIATDLLELHRLQEKEKRLGIDVSKSKLSKAEMLIKQKHSVEKIARDLVELQMKLANMGNYYTLSFLERYYNNQLSAHEEETFQQEQQNDQQSYHHVKESSVESLTSADQASKVTASSSAVSSSVKTRKSSTSSQAKESSGQASQISRPSSSHETFLAVSSGSSVAKETSKSSNLSRSSSFVRNASDNVSLSQFSQLTESTVRQPRASASVVSASVSARSSSQNGRSSSIRAAVCLNDMEHVILNSTEPVLVEETEVININGQEGVWVNKHEAEEWSGDLSLDQYSVNVDDDPEIVLKKSGEVLEYVQELAIRYLRPPTPQAPGEIIITQEPDTQVGPAPPIIIRQHPPRPETPEPLIIREAPPKPPAHLDKKIIKISGKRLPPPPRRVIIERLAPLPSKPQPVVVERWLPYPSMKRKVLFHRSSDALALPPKPKNLIIQWQEPEVQIRKEFKYLGSIKVEPRDYKETYGQELLSAKDLPDIVNSFQNPDGLELASEQPANAFSYELEGDILALRMVDLNKEGLEEYADFLNEFNESLSRASNEYRESEASITEQALALDSEIPVEFLAN